MNVTVKNNVIDNETSRQMDVVELSTDSSDYTQTTIDAVLWCFDQIGPPNIRWKAMYRSIGFFDNEALAMFLLSWKT